MNAYSVKGKFIGTGGTRLGAGRPAYRLKAEQTPKIDICIWHKRGLLWNGSDNTWSWTRGEESAGSIRFAVNADAIRLTYAVQGADASQTIRTTMTSCRYGGARTGFACPCCSGRAAVLFMRAGRFACRQCQKISYTRSSRPASPSGSAERPSTGWNIASSASTNRSTNR